MTVDPAVRRRRGLITLVVMSATIMHALDGTIANVALPSIQGSLSATQEQVSWVVTSYIVASAIVTPMTGWLADRLGKRELFLISIVGFVATSLACGIAWSLPSMVAFRLLQGIFGAAIVPLSQTFLLDINSREKAGQAMALWGAGIMIGPIIGPTLGGWLTESYNWRWVFFINLPVGIIAFLGCAAYLPRTERRPRRFAHPVERKVLAAVGDVDVGFRNRIDLVGVELGSRRDEARVERARSGVDALATGRAEQRVRLQAFVCFLEALGAFGRARARLDVRRPVLRCLCDLLARATHEVPPHVERLAQGLSTEDEQASGLSDCEGDLLAVGAKVDELTLTGDEAAYTRGIVPRGIVPRGVVNRHGAGDDVDRVLEVRAQRPRR